MENNVEVIKSKRRHFRSPVNDRRKDIKDGKTALIAFDFQDDFYKVALSNPTPAELLEAYKAHVANTHFYFFKDRMKNFNRWTK